jgi:hypothetical protein
VAVIAEVRIPYFLTASWIGNAIIDNVHTKLYQIRPITHNNETLMHIWTRAP